MFEIFSWYQSAKSDTPLNLIFSKKEMLKVLQDSDKGSTKVS